MTRKSITVKMAVFPLTRCTVYLLAAALLMIAGCAKTEQKLDFGSEYQAVFMDNGQVFFGKVENAGSDYPLLKDVHYIRSQPGQQPNQPVNILVKRGQEWHGPDKMYVSAKHILLIEPVTSGSKVAELLKQSMAQKQGQ